MKRIVLVVAAVLVAVAIAPVASAHKTHHTWWWSTSDAQAELRDTRLKWRTDEGQELDVVTRVKCFGLGRWWGGETRDAKLFQHFRCLVGTWDRESYWIVLHTTGEKSWFYTWDRWA
jgi:hypothetical protein